MFDGLSRFSRHFRRLCVPVVPKVTDPVTAVSITARHIEALEIAGRPVAGEWRELLDVQRDIAAADHKTKARKLRDGERAIAAKDLQRLKTRELACHTLAAGAHAPVIAFNCKQTDACPGEIAPTLRAMNSKDSHQNGGGQVGVVYQCHGSNVGPVGTLRTGHDVGGGVPFYATDYAVRRLTPKECERLMGIPDGFTRIPVRTYATRPKGKHFDDFRDLYEEQPDGSWIRFAPDGPRYKAIGNSWGRQKFEHVGRRIDAMDRILRQDREERAAE